MLIFSGGVTLEYDIYGVFSQSDFRFWKLIFENFLSALCQLSQNSVVSGIRAFNGSVMLSNELLTRPQFLHEMDVTLNRFQQRIPIGFVRTLDLVRMNIQGNALLAGSTSNWRLVQAEIGQGKNGSFLSVPIQYNGADPGEKSCSCATSRYCTTSAPIFNDTGSIEYTIEGLVFGCDVFQTVLLSSLSCFYSKSCIGNLRPMLVFLDFDLEEYHNNTGLPIRLDPAKTRFQVNDTIETMAYSMFIESWTSNVSYERYFASCAVVSCSYTLRYRFDALELLTTFLSVFAGLSAVLRFLVPQLVRMATILRHRFRTM